MKKLLLVVLLCAPFCTYSQINSITNVVSLDILAINDASLVPILRSIIFEEKKREYYRPDKLFAIIISPDSTYQIQAIDYLIASPKGIVKEFGLTHCQSHTFFVSGAYLDPKVFYRMGSKMECDYLTDLSYINDKNELVFLVSKEDGYSKWIYKYLNGEFVQLNFYDTLVK